MFGRNLVKWSVLLVNLMVGFLIVFTIIGSMISPEKMIFPAYFSLMFPITIFLNIAFVIFWVMLRKWYFLISLLLLIFSSSELKSTFPVHFGVAKKENVEVVKILTYNTMINGMLEKYKPEKPNMTLKYILESDADIVCIQEFSTSRYGQKFLTEEEVKRLFSKKYPYHYIRYQFKDSWHVVGVATFSKFPIVNKDFVRVNSRFNSSVYTDIKIRNQIVRLFNVHLESNRLTHEDKALAIKLKENFNTRDLSGTTMHLSRKLKAAYKIRACQADQVAQKIQESPYPVLVCGDFNDVPVSYAYTRVKGELKDAFSETGTGLGWTFNETLYRFRIDYVLFDPRFEVEYYHVDKVKYSDHYPVTCHLKL